MSRLRQKDVDPIRQAAEQAQSVRATSSLNPSTSGPMGAASLILHRNSYPIENALRGLDERLDAIDGGGLPGEGEPGVGGELDTLQDNLDLVEFNGGYRPPYRAEWRTIISALSSEESEDGYWLLMKVRKILVYVPWPPAYWTATGAQCSCAPFPPLYDVDLVTDLRCDPEGPSAGTLEKHIESICGVFGYTAEPEVADPIMCVESCAGQPPAADTTSEVAEVPAHGVLMETPALSNIFCAVSDITRLYARFRTVYVHALGAESDWIRVFVCECGDCPEDCTEQPQFLYVEFPAGITCGSACTSHADYLTLEQGGGGICVWGSTPSDVFNITGLTCEVGFWLLSVEYHCPPGEPFATVTYRKPASASPVGIYDLFEFISGTCPDMPAQLTVTDEVPGL